MTFLGVLYGNGVSDMADSLDALKLAGHRDRQQNTDGDRMYFYTWCLGKLCPLQEAAAEQTL